MDDFKAWRQRQNVGVHTASFRPTRQFALLGQLALVGMILGSAIAPTMMTMACPSGPLVSIFSR